MALPDIVADRLQLRAQVDHECRRHRLQYASLPRGEESVHCLHVPRPQSSDERPSLISHRRYDDPRYPQRLQDARGQQVDRGRHLPDLSDLAVHAPKQVIDLRVLQLERDPSHCEGLNRAGVQMVECTHSLADILAEAHRQQLPNLINHIHNPHYIESLIPLQS